MPKMPLAMRWTALMTLAFAAVPALAEDAKPAAAASQSLPAIVVTAVTARPMTDRVLASGTVKAVEEVYIQPEVEGLAIRSYSVDVGDRVAAGAVLATLNDDALLLQKSQMLASKAKAEAALAQAQAQLVEAQANARQAKLQQSRAQEMVKSGTVSTASVEQADAAAATADARVTAAEQAIGVTKADIKVADSQIADTELRLARTDVKTPVAGVVAARNARVGAIAAGAGEPLFTIIRDNRLELVAEASESDIVKIAPGQTARVRLPGGAELEGQVRLVSPTVDPTTRLGLVHILLPDGDKARAGMYGSAEIVIRSLKTAALPVSAVLTENGSMAARKVDQDRVQVVPVKTGIQDGAFLEITEGLSVGDRVVAKAGAYVRDGDRIRPVNEDPQASN